MAGYSPTSFFWVFKSRDGVEVYKLKKNNEANIKPNKLGQLRIYYMVFQGNFSWGTQQVVLRGQDSSILPAWVANHSTELIHLASSASFFFCGFMNWLCLGLCPAILFSQLVNNPLFFCMNIVSAWESIVLCELKSQNIMGSWTISSQNLSPTIIKLMKLLEKMIILVPHKGLKICGQASYIGLFVLIINRTIG